MLQPLLPPSTPNSLESSTAANLAPEVSQKPTETKSQSSTAVNIANSTVHELAANQALSAPSKPETSEPEFSPVNVEKSAAPLGEPLSVGYSIVSEVQQAAENLTQTIKQTKQKGEAQKLLTTQNRGADSEAQQQIPVLEYKDTNAPNSNNGEQIQNVIEFKSRNQTNPQTEQQPNQPPATFTQPTPSNTQQPTRRRIVEVYADNQVYDQERQVVTAEGNVEVRFDGAVVNADRLQISLENLISVGEGNVVVSRGDQILQGQRLTFNFVQDNGSIQSGRGEVFIPTAGSDLSFLPTDAGTGVPKEPLSDRVSRNQPVSNVASPGGINVVVGGGSDARNVPGGQTGGGEVRRIRFQADTIEFYPKGWQARNVRLTNDPFSPPEVEVRADRVTVTRVSPTEDRLRTSGQRIVFDQRFSVPIPIDSQRIDKNRRDVTPIVSFGYDGDQRGGFFVERGFDVVDTGQVRFSLTPQFYAQRAVQGGSNFASWFGLRGKVTGNLSPRTTVEANGQLTSFDLGKFENNFRANARLNQALGNVNPHTLGVEYTYRDRFFNGTLGFQEVQTSLGATVFSPIIPLGKSGLNFRYQAGAQYINANTDRPELLAVNRTNNRVSLARLQGVASIDGGVNLWQGKPLPPTQNQGLQYTPNPVVPYLRAFGSVTGASSYYTSGDNQATLIGSLGLIGQIGNFSRPFLDYTGFNISYSQGFNSGASPFLFDRAVDNRVLSAGITQQIYGPFRLGFQTSINLDTGSQSSTDYTLEYSRRSYGITLRYNPILELGAISFRLSDFNWSGGTDPFSDPSQVKPVFGGVEQR